MTTDARPVDYPVLVAGLGAALRGGADPDATVREMLTALVAALGAESGSVVSYDECAGRVVAVTAGWDWCLGRRVDRDHPAVRRLAVGDCVDLDVRGDLPAELADQLVARGMRRAAVAGIFDTDSRFVGSLHVYFRDPAGSLSQPGREALLLVGRLLKRVLPTRRADPADSPLAVALADGLAVLGGDGLVRSWNPAAQVLTGLSAATAVGAPLPFEVPEPGRPVEHELADGRWIQLLCATLTDSAERVVTFRDITPARRREQAKDLFVATASHELRTPLTVVRGYAETLDRRWDQLAEPERREAAHAIAERAERLTVLVDRLLVVGDDERVNGLLVPGEFDPVAALRAAAARLTADGPPKLVVDLPGRLPAALGDEGSIRTVLSELVRNARKYSPGGGDITLTAGADERTVYFRVADHGIGVPAEDLERAFDRFWQAAESSRRRVGGVGLGLYLVRRIVEDQHGWVSLRRRNPDGTVAEVRLPRAGVTSGEA